MFLFIDVLNTFFIYCQIYCKAHLDNEKKPISTTTWLFFSNKQQGIFFICKIKNAHILEFIFGISNNFFVYFICKIEYIPVFVTPVEK